MMEIRKALVVGAMALGGVALFSSVTGVSRTGGYGGYGGMTGGGMMGGSMMGGYGGAMGGYGGIGPWWGPLGFIVQLGFLLLLVGGAYLLYRAVADGGDIGGASDDALEELRKAYARGDVSDEEFESRRAALSRDGTQ